MRSLFQIWGLVWKLDPFSRFYFFGVVTAVACGCATLVAFILTLRRTVTSNSCNPIAALNNRYSALASIQSFAMLLTSGCVANQIFRVWFSYMTRDTDANPFFALHDAWAIFQILIFLHVLLDASRRFAWITLARIQTSQSA